MLIYVTCCIMARYDKFFSKGDYGMKEGKREEILRLIENKSRIDLKEAAILLGMEEAEVANAIADMEKKSNMRILHYDRLGKD